jgi:hypothetical protein
MSAVQKQAWFSLAVIALTTITVLALYPWLGARASGGFGMLGLIGLSAFFYSQRGKHVVFDERDRLINQRSNVVAYAVLWLAFVAAAMLAPLYFGEAVPTVVIQNSVWVAFMILFGVQSVAALVQYGRGAADAQ